MMDIYLKLRDPDEIDSSSREHWRFIGSSGIVEYQGSRRRTCCVISSQFCVGLRVFCGPILFGRCYSLALLQRFFILLLYLIHAATTLRFVAISLSLAATTIKSLQYNYHIATPLVCVAISKLPFSTTWYALQHLCFHLK